MVKPALGKGMKDLLPKNIGIPVQTEEGSEDDLIKRELKTNIERYSAQDYDVEPLKALMGRSTQEMKKGIELYRDNVKKLTSALTVLRSLEGYGYGSDIENIMKDMKDTLKTGDVLRRVELLKERALADQPGKDQRMTPRSRILKGLKAASEALKGEEDESHTDRGASKGSDLDSMDVDSLMDDLAQLGSAFSDVPEAESDEIGAALSKWEQEGYFVDRIREQIMIEGSDPAAELERFSVEVARIEDLKKRLDEIDPEGLEENIKKVRIKLPYTYMTTDIEHDIQELERIDTERKKKGEASVGESPAEPVVEMEKESVAAVPESDSEEIIEGAVPDVETTPEHVEEPDIAPMGDKPDIVPLTEGEDITGLTVDGILEKAKEAYGEDDLPRALLLFNEVLKKDPDNSKARFMIRRIGQKM